MIRVESASREHALSTEGEREIIETWSRELFAQDRDILDKLEWHHVGPDTMCIKVYCDNRLVSFAAVISRKIRFDDREVTMGGFKSLMTSQQHQGNGFASRALREAERVIFEDLTSDVGLLLCFDRLSEFYEHRGWERLRCPVVVTQTRGEIVWPFAAMALFQSDALRNPQKIHLCGPPF